MPKTILIPTDFKVASLTTLKWALDCNTNHALEIILAYPRYADTGITEMLFYSPDKIIKEKLTPEFTEAIEILKNRYTGSLGKIEFEVLPFNSVAYIKGFISSNHINEIYLPSSFASRSRENIFDPLPVLCEAGIPVFQTQIEIPQHLNEQQHLIALFS